MNGIHRSQRTYYEVPAPSAVKEEVLQHDIPQQTYKGFLHMTLVSSHSPLYLPLLGYGPRVVC
jgi:hypothetical protein